MYYVHIHALHLHALQYIIMIWASFCCSRRRRRRRRRKEGKKAGRQIDRSIDLFLMHQRGHPSNRRSRTFSRSRIAIEGSWSLSHLISSHLSLSLPLLLYFTLLCLTYIEVYYIQQQLPKLPDHKILSSYSRSFGLISSHLVMDSSGTQQTNKQNTFSFPHPL